MPHLILPCETRFREFDAKLLLACHAAERGWRVTLGALREIDERAARIRRGIYVAKGVTHRRLEVIERLRRLGHVITAWDEEGLVYASPEVYRATKVDPGALNLPRRLFAWGEANAQAWREHPDYAGTPISVTGNPRTDLLRPELRDYFAEEAARLRAQHGDFILINTNFSRLNNYLPGENHQRQLLEDGGGRIVSPDDPRLGWARHKQALFEGFLKMAPAVARRFPGHKLILRPHPSESPDIWRRVLADCPNAEVVYEGNVAAWLMAAAAMVHNGCTTAVESFLLDRPAIAYRPVVSEAFDHPLPNGLSLEALDLEALFARLEALLGDDGTLRAAAMAERRDLVRSHVASSEGDSACARIMAGLEEVAAAPEDALPFPAARALAVATTEARLLVRRLGALKPRRLRKAAYRRHKFPRVSRDEVAGSVRRFGALLDRFEGVGVEDLGGNLFRLTRA